MLNRWIGMGRLTRSPDIRNTQTGISVASFSIACERDYKGQDGKRETDYIDVVAWRHLADFAGKYLDKGRMIVVEGRWQMRDYTDREGKKRRTWDVLAESIYFADSKRTENQATAEPPSVGEYTELTDDDGELPF